MPKKPSVFKWRLFPKLLELFSSKTTQLPYISFYKQIKTTTELHRQWFFAWQRPTLPGPFGPSTIGARGLNGRVRDGYVWNPSAIATKRDLSKHELLKIKSELKIIHTLECCTDFHFRDYSLKTRSETKPATRTCNLDKPSTDQYWSAPCITALPHCMFQSQISFRIQFSENNL